MSTTETNHLNAGSETNNVTNTNDTSSDESGQMDASTTTTTTVRKRTRATVDQLSVLEDTFAANVSPNSKLRKELSERLQMSERSIQIWFQNRRAKVKHVQKRAQMQMQQASIRAQLYHYHQQQYGMQSYGGNGAPIMPLPHQQQQQQQMYPPRMPLPRSTSMDQSHHQQRLHNSLPTPPASNSSCTSSASPNTSMNPSIPQTHQLSYPSSQDNNTMEFPDYLHGGPLSPSLSPHHGHSTTTLSHPPSLIESPSGTPVSSSSMPSLVPVPDAGPTAMLATASSVSSSSSVTDPLVSTPVTPPCIADQTTVSPQDIWPTSVHQGEHMMRSQSVSMQRGNEISTAHLERSLSNPPMTTIDPSNLMMNATNDTTTDQQQQQQQHEPVSPPSSSTNTTDVYLNCTTLTIGTWHRLKLRASDLLCTFKRNTNTFEWKIEDAGCHFKMEIPLSSIANIDYVQDNNVLADVHFDISESPLFYMETTNNWVQCSDFTEGKQASRFFRHSLKGVSQQLKHDLMTLMDQCPETRRWIRFVEPAHYHHQHQHQHQHYTSPHQYHPQQQQQQQQPIYPLKHQQQHPYYSSSGMEMQPPYPMAATTVAPTPYQDPSFMTSDMVYPTNDPTTFSPSMYIPPSSHWSPMYQAPLPTQAPVMMGMTHSLV